MSDRPRRPWLLHRPLVDVILIGSFSATVGAQAVVCPSGVTTPYFGWDGTDCGRCNVYGTYLEYLTVPKIRDVRPDGPAAGQLQNNDEILAVDGLDITTADAWRLLRDAQPGRAVRFSVRRGHDTATATVSPASRCAPGSPPADLRRLQLGRGGNGAGFPAPRTFTVGNAIVEVSGLPTSVSYDERTQETVVVVGATVIRVKPK